MSVGGNDASSGLNWVAPKRTVTAALVAAQAGDEIRVATGTYRERIQLKPGVALYGGWSGQGEARDAVLLPSILDGQAAGCVVESLDAAAGPTTILDGFVIQNGSGVLGGGIRITLGSPRITHNLIRDNVSEGEGGAICCSDLAAPWIVNNTITGNLAKGADGDGGGLCCTPTRVDQVPQRGASPRILGNRFFYNVAHQNGGAICSKGESEPVIAGNQILMNLASLQPSVEAWFIQDVADSENLEWARGDRASVGGGGIAFVERDAGIVRDNLIAANGGMHGGGLLLYETGAGVQVINNTLAHNSPTGLRWMACSPLIANNLITGNGVGVSRHLAAPGEPPVFRHNCVFGNLLDFDGFTNPGFLDGENFDFHLAPGSPSLDSGTGDPVVDVDAEGMPRPLDGDANGSSLADLGAFERFASANLTPAVPTGLTASTGEFDYQVHLAWTPAALADGYEVWRAPSGSGIAPTLLTTVEGRATTACDDADVVPGMRYDYRLKARLVRAEVVIDRA